MVFVCVFEDAGEVEADKLAGVPFLFEGAFFEPVAEGLGEPQGEGGDFVVGHVGILIPSYGVGNKKVTVW